LTVSDIIFVDSTKPLFQVKSSKIGMPSNVYPSKAHKASPATIFAAVVPVPAVCSSARVPFP